MSRSGYIVTGGGRTGSHWLEQVIIFLTEINGKDISDITPDQPFVAHNHSIDDLLSVSESIRESCLLILTKRSDLFAQAISTVLARHTGEWFQYSTTPLSPFMVDTEYFENLLNNIRLWNRRFDQQVRPCYRSVIDINFETMTAQQPIEDWVAEKIGVPNTAGHKSWAYNLNPRNYAQVIENYQQLMDRFGKCALT